MASERIPVAVLGATGLVGQRFVARLADHPWFRLAQLAASERSAGRPYGEAAGWRVPEVGAHAGEGARTLARCTPQEVDAPVVFSALGAEVACEVEPAFARAGALVFSNASPFRMEPDVPLLVPEVNPGDLDRLEEQREARGWDGAIVCNPNCTSAVLVSALAPLHAAFGVERLVATTFQAASGAGLPGVPGVDLMGNVLPFIPGEEEKVGAESAKMLGAAFDASVACHRVPVVDGHTLSVSVSLGGDPTPAEVSAALASWKSEPQERALPSAPSMPLRVHAAPDRPQVRLDVDDERGMRVQVGRVRTCPVLGTRFVVLGHNLERGAAGGSVLNAELARARGVI
jgi:aspartate-semialdehyde dehydrogenase